MQLLKLRPIVQTIGSTYEPCTLFSASSSQCDQPLLLDFGNDFPKRAARTRNHATYPGAARSQEVEDFFFYVSGSDGKAKEAATLSWGRRDGDRPEEELGELKLTAGARNR